MTMKCCSKCAGDCLVVCDTYKEEVEAMCKNAGVPNGDPDYKPKRREIARNFYRGKYKK